MSKQKSIGAVILGGTGYGAGELLRLSLLHPEVSICAVSSSSAAGAQIGSAHPHLEGCFDIPFVDELDLSVLEPFEHRVVFSALPHGVSGQAITELSQSAQDDTIKFIDLSGDFRLEDEAQHTHWYARSPFSAELRKKFVYGLPELNREQIARASFVSNPGCLATASILAALPLSGFEIEGTIVLDAKTGSSGSGKDPRPTTHHPVRNGNFFAYKPLSHQHEPEIVQALSRAGMREPALSFVPQSIPISRGIYVTLHARTQDPVDAHELRLFYAEFYKTSPAVIVCEQPAQLANVVGSNRCEIGVATRDNHVVVTAAIDNLVKGMAGQAFQNLNVMCGLPELYGIAMPGLRMV